MEKRLRNGKFIGNKKYKFYHQWKLLLTNWFQLLIFLYLWISSLSFIKYSSMNLLAIEINCTFSGTYIRYEFSIGVCGSSPFYVFVCVHFCICSTAKCSTAENHKSHQCQVISICKADYFIVSSFLYSFITANCQHFIRLLFGSIDFDCVFFAVTPYSRLAHLREKRKTQFISANIISRA